MLIVDETGFLKKGTKSCGVARQYTRHGGRHRQLPGRASSWPTLERRAPPSSTAPSTCRANGRRTGSAGPRRASPTRCGSPPRSPSPSGCSRGRSPRASRRAGSWRTAFYGRSHALRRWLEERGRAYALMIPKTNAVRVSGATRTGGAAGSAAVRPDPSLEPVGVPGAVRGVRRRDAALAARPARRGGSERARVLPRLRPGGDDRGGVGPRVRRALADRGVLRAGEGGGRPGPVRGAHVGRHGTASSRSACWRTPTWSSCARPPGRRKPREKGAPIPA